jgi:hypothetical protein
MAWPVLWLGETKATWVLAQVLERATRVLYWVLPIADHASRAGPGHTTGTFCEIQLIGPSTFRVGYGLVEKGWYAVRVSIGASTYGIKVTMVGPLNADFDVFLLQNDMTTVVCSLAMYGAVKGSGPNVSVSSRGHMARQQLSYPTTRVT